MSVFLIETKTKKKTEKSMAIIRSDVQTPSPLRLSWFKLGELIINLRKIPTSYQPSARAVLENIGPRSCQYGPSGARSVRKTTEGQDSPVRLEQAIVG